VQALLRPRGRGWPASWPRCLARRRPAAQRLREVGDAAADLVVEVDMPGVSMREGLRVYGLARPRSQGAAGLLLMVHAALAFDVLGPMYWCAHVVFFDDARDIDIRQPLRLPLIDVSMKEKTKVQIGEARLVVHGHTPWFKAGRGHARPPGE